MSIEHKHYDNGYRAVIHDLEKPSADRADRSATGWGRNGQFDLHAVEVFNYTSYPFDRDAVKITGSGARGANNIELTLSKQDARNLAEALLAAAKDLDDQQVAKLRACRPSPLPEFYGVPDGVELPAPQPELGVTR